MTEKGRWRWLEANAENPEVQAMIRAEIRRGTFRLEVGPSGRLKIIPLDVASPPPTKGS